MVTRDPETGQFRSGGGSDDLDYTDHKFTNFSLEVEQQGDSNSTAIEEFFFDEPQLDNDELANLRYIHAGITVRNDPEAGTANTSPGSIHGQFALGVNLSGTEWVQDGSNSGVRQADVEEGAETSIQYNTITGSTGVGDDPGEWVQMTASAEAGFQDSGGGTAGGGSGGGDRVYRNFPAETGEGPWIDATDDVKGRIEIVKNTTDSDARLYATGQLGWVIVQDEGRRPRYGFGDD